MKIKCPDCGEKVRTGVGYGIHPKYPKGMPHTLYRCYECGCVFDEEEGLKRGEEEGD